MATEDAEPDEDLVHGDGAPVIVERRKARTEFKETKKSGTALSRLVAYERLLELEIDLIEERELTLPPAKFPWY